jgi:3'-5' exoribonuclease 1
MLGQECLAMLTLGDTGHHFTFDKNSNTLNFIIFDLEATCWEGAPSDMESEIIEIGAFRLNEFGEVRGKFDRFVRPVIHPTLSTFCRQLTTIEQVDVNRAATFPTVIEEFLSWAKIYEDEYVLCSWGGFDKRMLLKDCKLHRLDGEWANSHINLKEQYSKMSRIRNSIGLQKALLREGIPFTGIPHRAISDAENLTKLFLQYIGQWKL